MGEDDALLEIRCEAPEGMALDEALRLIEREWISDLVYHQSLDAHCAEVNADQGVFDFVTAADPGLLATGRISLVPRRRQISPSRTR